MKAHRWEDAQHKAKHNAKPCAQALAAAVEVTELARKLSAAACEAAVSGFDGGRDWGDLELPGFDARAALSARREQGKGGFGTSADEALKRDGEGMRHEMGGGRAQ